MASQKFNLTAPQRPAITSAGLLCQALYNRKDYLMLNIVKIALYFGVCVYWLCQAIHWVRKSVKNERVVA